MPSCRQALIWKGRRKSVGGTESEVGVSMGQGQVSADCGGPESTLLLGGKGTRNSHVFTFTKTGNINPIDQRFSHQRPKDCGGK